MKLKKVEYQPTLNKLALMAATTMKSLAYFFDKEDDTAVQAESASDVQGDKNEGDLEEAPSDAQTMEIVKEPKSASSSSSVSERYAFSSDPSSKVTEPKVKKKIRSSETPNPILTNQGYANHQQEESKKTEVKFTR